MQIWVQNPLRDSPTQPWSLTEVDPGTLFQCFYWRKEAASNQCGHVRFIQRNSIRLNTMDAARNAQGVHEGTESPVAKT